MLMSDPVIAVATEIVQQASPAAVQVRSFFDEATFTVTHVLSDRVPGKAAIIDSVLDFDPASGRTFTT